MEYETIPAKTILRKCNPNWYYLAYEYGMDLYRGCNHGCIYCYARSDYYEKTDDFSNIRVKENGLRILRDELRRKTQKGVIIDGGMSDPYNALDGELQLTRHAMELINAFEFGACVITKSSLVQRDLDVFQDIKQNAPVCINFSITCSDDEMAKKVEPYAPVTSDRFKALEILSKGGIPTGVLMDPMMPYLTDTEENVREMVKKAKAYGASYMYISTSVTMSDIQRDFYYQEVDKIIPGLSEKLRKKYDMRYRCKSPKGKKLFQVFAEECEKEGLNYDMKSANIAIRKPYNLYENNLLNNDNSNGIL